MEGQFGLEFVYAESVNIKGKKNLWAVDNYGYVNYFFTRNWKQFAFSQRSYSGGILNSTDNKIDSIPISNKQNNIVTDIS